MPTDPTTNDRAAITTKQPQQATYTKETTKAGKKAWGYKTKQQKIMQNAVDQIAQLHWCDAW